MHRNQRHGPGIMLLAYHIFSIVGLDHIPPLTLATIGLQVAIFLRLFKLPWKTSEMCMSVYFVWYGKDWKRLILGALEHADDWHLYYNMVSFILKGQSLERRFGFARFFCLLLSFTFLTSVTTVLLYYVTAEVYDSDYEYHCSVGFSGVIFALKVLTTYYNPNYQHYVMGIPVFLPASYVVWAELLLIQIFVPRSSFLGHFAGILVGLAYVKGPLKSIINILSSIFFSFQSEPRQRFVPNAAPSGYRPNGRYAPRFEPSAPHPRYEDYIPEGMSEEDQLREATHASLMENYRYRSDDLS